MISIPVIFSSISRGIIKSKQQLSNQHTTLHYRTLTKNCTQLKSLMVQRCDLVTERALAPLRGKVHIDRPARSANVMGDGGGNMQLQLYDYGQNINRLFLQV